MLLKESHLRFVQSNKQGIAIEIFAFFNAKRWSDRNRNPPRSLVLVPETKRQANPKNRLSSVQTACLHFTWRASQHPESNERPVNTSDIRRAVAFLISVDVPAEKTVRINITARESPIEAIDRVADEAGMTRSAYVVRSALGRVVSRTR